MTRSMPTSLKWSPLKWRAAILGVNAMVFCYFAFARLPTGRREVVPGEHSTDRGNAQPSPQFLGGTQDFGAIAAHPIFSPSRQAWVAPPQPSAALSTPSNSAPQPPRGYTLLGIVVSGDQNEALLKNAAGRSIIVRKGQMLDGWTVLSVNAAGVHLGAGGSDIDLVIPKAHDSNAPHWPTP